MMIIYGASKSGEIAYHYLTAQKGIKIIGFIDKHFDCTYKEISGEKYLYFPQLKRYLQRLRRKAREYLLQLVHMK
ncbi:nucleoside-diphosphate sugar epimerase/dehydratase [Paenibacillus macerans]|uniref:nucleoside-diphosphate sugar epimerase/dehydratase n=1 Tax=Paenibacillus macerans TaxID=44252 RepID=UPI0020408DE0|nr:hypothetical protein [Paenibacillus macerans]MCM3701048.1 hypothetical protein [Paenibacillus macerans]